MYEILRRALPERMQSPVPLELPAGRENTTPPPKNAKNLWNNDQRRRGASVRAPRSRPRQVIHIAARAESRRSARLRKVRESPNFRSAVHHAAHRNLDL